MPGSPDPQAGLEPAFASTDPSISTACSAVPAACWRGSTRARNASRPGQRRPRSVSTVSLRCFVTQQDIANMALYLSSPFGATVSGQAISVDGGMEGLS